MAEFRARPPLPFNPTINDFTSFSSCHRETEVYILATDHFADTVTLPIQQAQLFNLAGPDFMKFAHQRITIYVTMTITDILDAIQTALKPQRFDSQNRRKLFRFQQSPHITAGKFMQELQELYTQTNYPDTVPQETLLRDLFIVGVALSDAQRLLFQQDSDALTLDKCLHLVSNFESALSDHVASEAISSTVEEEAVIPTAVSSISKGIPRLSLSFKAHCHGCGQQPSRHSRQNCPAYHVSCHNCGKTGHFSKVCRQTRINAVETVDVSDRNNSPHISAATTPRIGQRHLAATINGKTVDMLIDSGSDLTIVSENNAKCLGLVFSPVARPVQNIVSANRTQVKMIGTITDACMKCLKAI